ncbi:MAG: alpha/beta fold hydrolase [Bacteroidota bacterium]
MASTKIQFPNALGELLSAKLDVPVNQHPHTFAVFAHCFTCNKNLSAVRNISRALNQAGIAVLRFDFTGLGESEGEFADTNFTSNVEDLIAACTFLAEQYQAPELIVGHSLGGAAVICAADKVASIKAIATIGAPFAPNHVSHLIATKAMEIEAAGEAEVVIGGRAFKVKKQFLEDIIAQSLTEKLRKMRKAILVLHSPQDEIVEIENAAKLYHAAFHPKSFISLDGADHLLSDKADSNYTGTVIANWASRYITVSPKSMLDSDKQVAVRLGEKGFTSEVMVRHHHLTADEPASVGGNDFGPTPYELVSAGLGACTAMTIQMYARRKKWLVEEVVVHIDHKKDHAEDCEHCDETKNKIDVFDRTIELKGDLSEEQITRLMEIADRCPVHRTLHEEVLVKTALDDRS